MTDFILHKKKLVSEEKCNEIIRIFEKDKTIQEGSFGSEKNINENLKKCSEIYVNTGQSVNDNKYNPLFINELMVALEEYKEKFPFLNKIEKWGMCNQYKIQRYYPNEGFFLLHCENYGPIMLKSKELCPTSYRTLVWMVYLNDVTDGGYTEFPTQKKLIAPRTGDILIWPAFWTHPHRGITSKTQTKYIVTGWWTHSL
tara:strand:+ start:283 stop:879 length:597 start_codon:yes stop_codon:yes gene_type:complete